MKYNYKIIIEYDGSNYVGWQFQNNGTSIQEKIEKKIKKILKKKIKIIAAGRTDKGVHALGQCAHFFVDEKLKNIKKFLKTINFFLSKDLIVIKKMQLKKINFHARFSAKERIYQYVIVNREGGLVLDKNRAWLIRKKLDLKLLKRGGRILEGKHDYSTFRSSSCTALSPLKKINYVKVNKYGEKIYIKFSSKSFLQNQVRSMVGCLYYLSSGKWTLKKFRENFKSKKRQNCAPPAPASGLYLSEIKY